MKKPEVTLENYETVYEYYRQYQQPRIGAYIGHSAMALMFRPNVRYAPGAEDAIQDLLHEEDGRVILAFNHLSDRDQYVVGAMARREPVMRQMAGNTFIQSKEVLFHHPNKLLRPLLRQGVDIMGAIPAFRKKDIDESQDSLRKRATSAMLRTSVEKLRNGQHMAVFPEGTRNKEHPDTVQDIKPGIFVVAGQVAATHQVGIIPVGFTYGDDMRHPDMWVDLPMIDDKFDADVFQPALRNVLQFSVTQARSSEVV